ncbi:MAG: serine/threonine-protein kinase [Polyangiaceae bacterium]|jgi:serine/threonine-protein kinase
MASLGPSTLIAGRYRIVRLIGRGGGGTVHEVEHAHTGQRLALKVFNVGPDTDLARFSREARAMSRLQTEHVVRITDADFAPELGGVPFLVMELLEGSDLERVAADGAIAVERAVDWLRQVARGLDAVHAAGIVHRDLKPQNLFLVHREDGRDVVKILDFGISRITADGDKITITNQFLGTPCYMAPEQADSRGAPVTHQADLFALGLVTFRLLVGRIYWNSGNLSQLLAQLLVEPMVPPSARGAHFGPEFDAWFARACHRDAGRRFASAHEQVRSLVEALRLPPSDALGTLAKTTPSSGFLVPAPAQPRKHVWRWRDRAGLVIALVAIALVTVLARNVATRHANLDAGSTSPTTTLATAPTVVSLPGAEDVRQPSVSAPSLIYGPIDTGAPARAEFLRRLAAGRKALSSPDAGAPPPSRLEPPGPTRDPLEGQF